MLDNQLRTNSDHAKKTWISGGIFGFIVVILLLLKATFSVLLLLLTGTLMAVFFGGLTSLVVRKTGWNATLSRVLSVLVTFGIIIGLFWIIGSRVQQQASQLSDTLPATIENAQNYLSKSALGQRILDKADSTKTASAARAVAGHFFSSTFGIFGDLYVVLFIGLFFTASPDIYKKGLVQLVPRKGQSRAQGVLEKLDSNLCKWLKSILFSMSVVFALTAIGLAIMGIDMWLVLALIAGLLTFIPNIGPLIAMIPAVLVGLMISPTTAALVAGLYILIQTIESNLITPVIQKKLLKLPPALTLIAQLVMSTVTGGWGLVVATPLLVVVRTIVQDLYVDPNNQKFPR
ncbi:MAG: AI-2E family transporter [Chitinophagaceae bacterium]